MDRKPLMHLYPLIKWDAHPSTLNQPSPGHAGALRFLFNGSTKLLMRSKRMKVTAMVRPTPYENAANMLGRKMPSCEPRLKNHGKLMVDKQIGIGRWGCLPHQFFRVFADII